VPSILVALSTRAHNLERSTPFFGPIFSSWPANILAIPRGSNCNASQNGHFPLFGHLRSSLILAA